MDIQKLWLYLHIEFYITLIKNLNEMSKEKMSVMIRITLETREKLDKLKNETGLPYGTIIDIALAQTQELVLTVKNEA